MARIDPRSHDARDIVEPTLGPQSILYGSSWEGGFDWVSAAIGASAGTGLLIALLAIADTGRRTRRRSRRTTPKE